MVEWNPTPNKPGIAGPIPFHALSVLFNVIEAPCQILPSSSSDNSSTECPPLLMRFAWFRYADADLNAQEKSSVSFTIVRAAGMRESFKYTEFTLDTLDM
jgi:hypothetical protein